ncbi:MAG TPA: TRAP transporter small permease [Kofleriaceae bacterium]|nr:TRAP transporter small permease [Kofleriaceae bacterium]
MSAPSDGVEQVEPPERASHLDLGAPLSYPDDGSLSRAVRRIETWIGRVEQGALILLLACVVLVAAGHALLDRFAEIQLSFKDDVVRGGTFAMAMLGAAFASHQVRHLSMDLVSRRLSPRARLFLQVALAVFTIVIVVLFVRSGLHVVAQERTFQQDDRLLSSVRIAYLIPLGGGLIILHTVLHAIIDLDYIIRRKTPPERIRSAH